MSGLLPLKGSGRSRNEDRLIKLVIELVEVQRTVVICRGQTEAVVDKSLFSSAVARAHGAYLGQRDMALVHYQKKIVGEVIQKRVWNASRGASCQYSGVVLDTLAEAYFLEHFNVVIGTLGNALGFDQHFVVLEILDTLVKLLFYFGNCLLHSVAGNYIV